MKKNRLFIAIVACSAVLLLFSIGFFIVHHSSPSSREKIKGFNLVAPKDPFPIDSLQSIQKVGAEWVAVVPYAICDPATGSVVYGNDSQWWGETPVGIITTIQMAHRLGLKVMLKPHLWVKGQGWAGDLDFENDAQWKNWEAQYTNYLATYTEIARRENVALFCIGTELRQSTKKRAKFWINTIESIRQKYTGDLTYAANWDEYQKIDFWKKLDYIGIDAYFPLSTSKLPEISELNSAWLEPIAEMKAVSLAVDKPILFTEYGYESVDYATIGHWNIDKDSLKINYEAQRNAFAALFNNFSTLEWWAGGFVWKWHLINHKNRGKAYTPQNKPAIWVISQYFQSRNTTFTID